MGGNILIVHLGNIHGTKSWKLFFFNYYKAKETSRWAPFFDAVTIVSFAPKLDFPFFYLIWKIVQRNLKQTLYLSRKRTQICLLFVLFLSCHWNGKTCFSNHVNLQYYSVACTETALFKNACYCWFYRMTNRLNVQSTLNRFDGIKAVRSGTTKICFIHRIMTYHLQLN